MAKKLTHLVAKVELDAPLKQVWKSVALNFGNVAEYNPAVDRSEFISDIRAGVGTKRLCHVDPKGFLKEEITQWEEGKSFELEVTETSFPMDRIVSLFTFTPSGNKTILQQDFWYRMKFPMGWMSRMMKKQMQKTLIEGLEGLDYYLRYGQKKEV